MTEMGRQASNATRQPGRLLCARNPPFQSGFTIFSVEWLLLRQARTTANYFFRVDELPFTAYSVEKLFSPGIRLDFQENAHVRVA